jgi:predicted TIM-barrel fold metal-dependent hydrolase
MAGTYLRQLSTTSAPARRAPAYSCDCHFHIFGPPDCYPFAEDRSYTPPEAGAAEYLAMLATLGIERMVIVQPSVYGFDNRCSMDAIAAFGLHRARGIVMVPPDIDGASLQALHEGGARGVRLITVAKGGAALDQLRYIADRIAPFGWHIQIYVPAQTWQELEATILDLPVPVVMDHMAGLRTDQPQDAPASRAVLRLLDSGRCWVKLSGYRASAAGAPYADVAPLARRLAETVPERCVWGTDWPHPDLSDHMPDDGKLLDLLSEWVPDAARLHAILVDNPASLYGFA